MNKERGNLMNRQERIKSIIEFKKEIIKIEIEKKVNEALYCSNTFNKEMVKKIEIYKKEIIEMISDVVGVDNGPHITSEKIKTLIKENIIYKSYLILLGNDDAWLYLSVANMSNNEDSKCLQEINEQLKMVSSMCYDILEQNNISREKVDTFSIEKLATENDLMIKVLKNEEINRYGLCDFASIALFIGEINNLIINRNKAKIKVKARIA